MIIITALFALALISETMHKVSSKHTIPSAKLLKKKTTKVLQKQPSRSNSRRQRLTCPLRYKVDVALAGGPTEREMVTSK